MPNQATTSSSRGVESRSRAIDGWDMSRMLKFIEQESEQKAHELKIKANEEYSIEVAELAQKATTKITEDAKKEIARLQTHRVVSEGKMRCEANLLQMKEKEKIAKSIMGAVCEQCASKGVPRGLILSTLRAFQAAAEKSEFVVYVQDKDRDFTQGVLEKKAPGRFEILKMNQDLLGGIVIRDKGKTMLVNNSYLERIKSLEGLLMPMLSKSFFK